MHQADRFGRRVARREGLEGGRAGSAVREAPPDEDLVRGSRVQSVQDDHRRRGRAVNDHEYPVGDVVSDGRTAWEVMW